MIRTLWSKCKEKLGQIKRRTIVLFVIGAILFLLPTSIAIGWATEENKPKETFSFSVTVFDQNRNQIATATASEDHTTGDNMADVLYRIISESKSIQRPPFPPEDGTPIYVSAVLNGVTTEYVCYFSVSGDGSYYIKNGNYFSIPTEEALAFISFPEAESLYRIAEPPILLTNTNETILPIRASWFYRLGNNTFQQAKNAQLTENVTKEYSFESALAFQFSNEPDFCYVSVVALDTGRLAFEGSREELASFTVNQDTPLQIHLRAVWTEREASMCYGELSYNFIAKLRDCAIFSLNQQTLSPSDFLILTCQNVRSPEELFLQAPETMTRHFFTKGSTVYCVIPYPTDFVGDTLNFTATHGASKQTFSVALTDDTPASTHVIDTPSADMLNAALQTSQSTLDALLNTKWTAHSQTVYFQGNTVSLEGHGFEKGYAFGDQLRLSEQTTIMAKGTEYLAASGTAVPALMSGEVVATGYCEALGNYVVLHHGLGIQTWYAHLSDFNVRIGDIIAAKQTIGKAGIGGIYTGSGTLILCTVNGRLCDPASLKK